MIDRQLGKVGKELDRLVMDYSITLSCVALSTVFGVQLNSSDTKPPTCARNGSHQAKSRLCVRKRGHLWPRRRGEAWFWSDSGQGSYCGAESYRLSVSAPLFLPNLKCFRELTDIRIAVYYLIVLSREDSRTYAQGGQVWRNRG